jgi:hypothetical protein
MIFAGFFVSYQSVVIHEQIGKILLFTNDYSLFSIIQILRGGF